MPLVPNQKPLARSYEWQTTAIQDEENNAALGKQAKVLVINMGLVGRNKGGS
jgi:hypothetical protein